MPAVPLKAAAVTDALLAILKLFADDSIKPPLPLAPNACADKVPATKLLSPHVKMLPPSPLTVLLALKLLVVSIVVLAEVGIAMTDERLGRSAA